MHAWQHNFTCRKIHTNAALSRLGQGVCRTCCEHFLQTELNVLEVLDDAVFRF
jgi:hypothetical protein